MNYLIPKFYEDSDNEEETQEKEKNESEPETSKFKLSLINKYIYENTKWIYYYNWNQDNNSFLLSDNTPYKTLEVVAICINF